MRASKLMHRAAVVVAGIAAILGMLLTGPANASTTSAAPNGVIRMSCGYDGYANNSSQPYYTHCGRGPVEIRVNHFFWETTYFCAIPGTQQIPQGDSSLSIINAEYDGVAC